MARDRKRSAQGTTTARSLPRTVGRFVQTEASGGIALVVAAAVALAWANSPWQGTYESLWHSKVNVTVGVFEVSEDLRHFVNDALMAVFFFVVGLEIKREVVHGELSDRRVAALSVFAALGGMVAPAALYLLVAGGAASDGWGIPIATDIAFALGVLGLLGARVPSSLKLFLLTLAIVDDVGAIVVIAVVYSGRIDGSALAVAGLGVALSLLLRHLRVAWPPIYIALAVGTWYATYRSGVHATIAGVALALATPTERLAPTHIAKRWAEDLSDEPTAAEIRQMTVVARETVSPAEQLQEVLHPVSSFVVLPVFALANAGVELRGDMLDAPGATKVALGVAVGLVVGKLVGILAGAWVSTRMGIATVPAGLSWRQIAGAAALGGIGFTVSLFIAGLGFTDSALEDAAKLAILGASVVAALVGAAVLLTGPRTPPDRWDAAPGSAGSEPS